MKKITYIFLTLTLLLTACAQNSDLPSLTTEELITKMKTDSSLVVLDIRTAPELVGPLGKIDEAVHIPLQELQKRIDELNKYKDNPIAVICRSGNRSQPGTKILLENGFNAYNVKGGMSQYRKDLETQK